MSKKLETQLRKLKASKKKLADRKALEEEDD